jgi:hypothetical protein
MPRSTRQGWPPLDGGCEVVGVAVGDDDVIPGAGDALGVAVADFWTGEGTTAAGIDAGVAACRGGDGALSPGRGLRERCGDVFVVRPRAGAWTRPAPGSLLALNGA